MSGGCIEATGGGDEFVGLMHTVEGLTEGD